MFTMPLPNGMLTYQELTGETIDKLVERVDKLQAGPVAIHTVLIVNQILEELARRREAKSVRGVLAVAVLTLLASIAQLITIWLQSP